MSLPRWSTMRNGCARRRRPIRPPRFGVEHHFYLYAEAEDNQDRLPAGPDQWVRRPVSRLMADPNGKASVAYWFRFGLKGSPGLRSLWDMNVNVVLKLESPTDDFARPILQFTYQD